MRIPFYNCKKIPEIKYHFKPLNGQDLAAIRESCQEYSDCYLVSSIDALTQSKEGRKLLFKNVKKAVSEKNAEKGYDAVKVVFNNVFNQKCSFIVTLNDYFDNLRKFKKQKNFLLFAFEMSMQNLLVKYPSLKPLIIRITRPFKSKFEFNKPSNFMKAFTGKEPIVIAESDININLESYSDKVFELFKKMSKTKDNNYSFIAGTGVKSVKDKGIANWHCLVIDNVDYENKVIFVRNKRGNGSSKLTFDEFINKFKFVVGYFDENLKN